MEQFTVPRDLTALSLRAVIDRVFEAFDATDPMRDSLLLLCDSLPVIFATSHLVRYMVEKNWDFPAAFAADPQLYIQKRAEGKLGDWIARKVSGK
jgi:hypothetical protein